MQRYLNIVGAKNEAARALTPGALYAQVADVAKDFVNVGFPAGKLATTYAIAQMMHESDWMTSNLANVDHNYSGIKFLNKSYQKATRGLPAPKSEGGGNYAHFNNFQDWARDYLRILSLNIGGQGRPIDAQTAQQYMDRLRANRYFTDPSYYGKFNAALKKVSAALNYGKSQEQKFLQQYKSGQDTFTETSGEGLTSNEEFTAGREFNKVKLWVKDHPLATTGIVLAGILVLVKISK